jgi:F-type H+-transporting ATPase subunit b
MTWLLAAAAEEHNPIVPSLAEFLVATAFFGVLVLLVAKFVVPVFERTYAERTAAIEGGIEHAKQAQAEADEAKAHYEAQLAEAHGEANRIREAAREQAAAILAEARETAQSEAARIVASGHTQVDAERSSAAHQLRSEVGSLAATLAERIVGESLQDDERSARVIDRFLADLEQQEPAGTRSEG